LYLKNGFRIVNGDNVLVRGVAFENYAMTKDLPAPS
jgi:hypothetical protein